MAVRIRLKRLGAHKAPFYRLEVSDSRFARDGRFIEEIGTFDPIAGQAAVTIDEEKALKWLQTGAQASDTVRNLFSKAGILKKFHDSKHQK